MFEIFKLEILIFILNSMTAVAEFQIEIFRSNRMFANWLYLGNTENVDSFFIEWKLLNQRLRSIDKTSPFILRNNIFRTSAFVFSL